MALADRLAYLRDRPTQADHSLPPRFLASASVTGPLVTSRSPAIDARQRGEQTAQGDRLPNSHARSIALARTIRRALSTRVNDRTGFSTVRVSVDRKETH